ncbi:MAG: hypothetical protein JWO60_1298 [Frankiales bacterium]|nr:hypothetical protein [Frankiales bacterium]
MRQVLVESDRESVRRLNDDLLGAFPELPPGVVLGAVTRARRDLSRLGHCDGLWEAVELVARQRLVEQTLLRAIPEECAGRAGTGRTTSKTAGSTPLTTGAP